MIQVDNISKTYLVWRTPSSRLLVPLISRLFRKIAPNWVQRLREQNCHQVNALQQVSFSLAAGDSLGIIGFNGSGKSTLLQIIAGTLQPSEGTVKLTGRVAALLELGSGFDPEFTGRENIFLNASILGLTREEISSKYQSIVDFADIGDFIDRPVKTYSSGMMVRLAFAVQVHVEPEVLIVDEALSVGDARFQAKALAKIESILQSGTTLLFVGHDLSAVRAFCNRAMLLDKGKIIREGIPDDVISDYLYLAQQEKIQSAGIRSKIEKHDKGFYSDLFFLKSASINNDDLHQTLRFSDTIQVNLQLQTAEAVVAPFVIVDLVDARGLQITGRRIPVEKPGLQQLDIGFACHFQKGIYRIRIRLVSAPSLETTTILSRYDDWLSFELIDDVRSQFTGLFPLDMDLTWRSVDSLPSDNRSNAPQ